MAIVHWILQGKGGVGKSFIASALIQYLRQQELPVLCIDTDPVNSTLGGYREFEVQVIDIMDGDNVNSRKFDEVVELILSADEHAHVVIDNGASSFIPLLSYLKDNDVINLITDSGHKMFMHTVITGGQAIGDTLQGLKSLCINFPTVPIVIWLNLYFGDIVYKGNTFTKFPVYKEYQEQFHGFVSIPNKNKDTFGKDVEELLARKESFAMAMNSSLPIMARQRLKTFWNAFSQEIAQANLLN